MKKLMIFLKIFRWVMFKITGKIIYRRCMKHTTFEGKNCEHCKNKLKDFPFKKEFPLITKDGTFSYTNHLNLLMNYKCNICGAQINQKCDIGLHG